MMTLDALFQLYLDEFSEKYGRKYPPAETILKNYRDDIHEIYMITPGCEAIGFFIVGLPPDCHPKCNYYICETYLYPHRRNRGIMSSAITEYLNDHPGTYTLDVIDGNTAIKFWRKVFERAGYREIHLKDVSHGTEGQNITTYYFTNKEGGAE